MLTEKQLTAVRDGIGQIKSLAKEFGVSETVVATVVGTVLAKQPVPPTSASKAKEIPSGGGTNDAAGKQG